jgi:N-acetylglucosaminyl-diphospho-decaprenol L-rhamnosyltransferase
VSYDSHTDLPDCLASISRHINLVTCIVVVDNGPDQSASSTLVQSLPAHDPSISVVPFRPNRGFGAACNEGAQSAGPADLLLILNPDARLLPGTVPTMVAAFRSNPSLGIASPTLIASDGQVAEAGGTIPTPLGSLSAKLRRLLGLHTVPRPYEPRGVVTTDWVSGAAMMIRRDAWDVVGGFDERFFLYMEDVDLCLRVRAAGWTVGIVPAAQVVHAGGGSQRHPDGFRRAQIAYERSLFAFHTKYFGRTTAWVARFLRLIYVRTGLRVLVLASLRRTELGN